MDAQDLSDCLFFAGYGGNNHYISTACFTMNDCQFTGYSVFGQWSTKCIILCVLIKF